MKTSTIIYVACEIRPRHSRRQIEYIGHRTGYHTPPFKMSTGITLRLITSFSTSIYIVHISLEKPKMLRTPIRKSDRSQNSRIHRLQNGPSYHVQMVLMHRHQVVQTASPMKISNDSSTKRLFVSLTKVQKATSSRYPITRSARCLIPLSTNRAHSTARKYISVERVRLTILSRENRYS